MYMQDFFIPPIFYLFSQVEKTYSVHIEYATCI